MTDAEALELFAPMGETLQAPGVLGTVIEHDGAIYIPTISAVRAGSGDVGRYLDSLPTNRTIRVPTVMSRVLEGMLRRRGYVQKGEFSAEWDEWVDIWERAATT